MWGSREDYVSREKPHEMIGPMISKITEIKHKQRLREPLTPDELAFEREYQRRYRGRQVSIYPRAETKQRWAELAKAKGESLSTWAMQQVEDSLVPNPAVEAIGQEMQAARVRISTLDAMLSQALTDKKHLEDQLRLAKADLEDAVRAELRYHRGAQ